MCAELDWQWKTFMQTLNLVSPFWCLLQAIRAGAERNHIAKAYHLLKAKKWNQCHSAVMEHIASDAVVNGKESLCLNLTSFIGSHRHWSLSLHFNGHFPGEPGLASFIVAKDDGSGGDNWSYETCKAPVRSSPSANQHLTFYGLDALPVAQPTVSKHRREISHSMDLLTPSSPGGLKLCLWPLEAPGYLEWVAMPLTSPLIPVPQYLVILYIGNTWRVVFRQLWCTLHSLPAADVWCWNLGSDTQLVYRWRPFPRLLQLAAQLHCI